MGQKLSFLKKQRAQLECNEYQGVTPESLVALALPVNPTLCNRKEKKVC
jgi:hypothetical protein